MFEQLEMRLLLDAVAPPYLQAVATDSAYVLVEADDASIATVEYGLTASYGLAATTENSESTQGQYEVHNVKLTGLSPNTQYHYRVKHGGETGTTSADYTFRTAAQAGTDFRFAWMADTRTQTAIHDTVAGLVDGFDPRFSLYGGDLCESASLDSHAGGTPNVASTHGRVLTAFAPLLD